MNHKEITTLWSWIIVEELVRNSICFFCISPGSRSTPLTVAASRHQKTTCKIFPDERAAAFFALGYARATGRPAVLICTSGTAAANYFPAVVEASMGHQPMLVLSADRPFELRETGANQTIRQSGIYGSYSRWSFQLPEPSTDTPPEAILSAIDYAVSTCTANPSGPVHLNIAFREPLEPVPLNENSPWLSSLGKWNSSRAPWSRTLQRQSSPESASVKEVARLLASAENPLIIAGHLDRPADAQAVLNLSKSLNIALYADISSQLRLHKETVALQQAWLSDKYVEQHRADLVLHFGGSLVGKKPGQAMKTWRPDHTIVIKNHPDRYAPDHTVTMSIEASVKAFAEALAKTSQPQGKKANPIDEIEQEIERFTRPDSPVTEISAARIVSRLIDPGHGLFLANSMPVRDMDMYATRSGGTIIPTAMNRGASGIDGIISSAAGFASGLERPVTLLIGDISFLHDMNALCLLRSMTVPLTIVVINNNGGGIFSFLPISDQPDVFEKNFGTPQEFNIAAAATAFSIEYQCPPSNAAFSESYMAARSSAETSIIEIRSRRDENLALHRKLNQSLIDRLDRQQSC
ncbi:2-succinyl-6-hydroxy-2,4-cyclohexadiene-1-carboxylic acid synthase/2-oxoglutarate decarboxylase [Prosthecochloris aestuarii DSM 271]|uniref:2-succinyl-5-enolpyruvyl-6-hydroxy-3-cyclohexene-1-carboxylate synthase n=1 Tax=Prosthecochloris aestuarii (strain DSM 271 / SK 413) TaxID=290512 RepID=MEND_PROA2|nr:2-succinyl-5-enolpyruvyl-6-hydroxy-3-cyclohexene-1-carboxylic-acid synthase [Prosthecochloris aestuarii]B4S4J4.1 RecName: Full=2-succinyl-5-enolpyruvyl-6-hydroxy-3-cyclohexene-1-carboxylate synthase; Short=SEPHCHC synthase; AltName: Full=Menaquinone biosynthesis protein MenD [Prosthecochloris aestuarii DSM 271]ACF46890.1 2-succinyl-6-hydroxy-2,4-cyclohexadiene-1-carboxylic acid synthase/2-oxoglutarate decarboxylase [Prosthecochloris aestuarii DSM 271]